MFVEKWKNKNTKKKILLTKILSLFLSLFTFGIVLTVGILYTIGPNKWVVISVIPESIRPVGREFLYFLSDLTYISYEFKKHNLPMYNLEVKKEDLDFLRENLPEPYEQITEEYKVYVPAEFIDGTGTKYDVRIKNRGVSRNHWLWDKKSIRVNFDEHFGGIKNLNFITPIDRLYLVEEINNFRARQLGLFVPRSYFSVVTINGQDPVVYWTVEHYDKEFIEVAGLSSDANFYGEGDNYIRDESYDYLYGSVLNWKKYNSDLRLGENNFAEIDLLMSLVNEKDTGKFYDNIFALLDEENFYNWNIHNILTFGQHQDWEHNVRLYFDSSVGKFKFSPVDVSMADMNAVRLHTNVFEEHSNPILNKLLAKPEIMAERNRRLYEYLEDESNLEEILDYYDSLYDNTKVAFYQDKIRRFDNRYFDDTVAEYRRIIISNWQILADFFKVVEYDYDFVPDSSNIKINLATKSLSPLSIEKIEVSGVSLTGKKLSLKSSEGIDICQTVVEEGAKISIDCTQNIINPEIEYIQLPSPESILPRVNDFYKAHAVAFKNNEFDFSVSDTFDLTDIELLMYLKNNYTDEVSQVSIKN